MLFSNCQFNQCSHIHEPSCGIIEAVKTGLINKVRYENYCKIYEELKEVNMKDIKYIFRSSISIICKFLESWKRFNWYWKSWM